MWYTVQEFALVHIENNVSIVVLVFMACEIGPGSKFTLSVVIIKQRAAERKGLFVLLLSLFEDIFFQFKMNNQLLFNIVEEVLRHNIFLSRSVKI